MARSQIVITDIEREGAAPGVVTVSDAVNNHYIVGNDGNVFFEVINPGSAGTLTFESPLEVDGLGLSELEVDIDASGTTLVGNFRRKTFNQSTDGTVFLNPSASGWHIRAFRSTPAG